MLAGVREDFSNSVNIAKRCLSDHLLKHKSLLFRDATSCTKLEEMNVLCVDESSLEKCEVKPFLHYFDNLGIKCILFSSSEHRPDAIQ